MHPLPPETLHLPFGPGPYRMAMGLVARSPDDLVELDDRYPQDIAERRHLLATRHADVFATTPGSEPARAETLAHLADLLSRRHPSWFNRTGGTIRNHLTSEDWSLTPDQDPLEVAGRLVQEDFCLIDTSGPAPVLAAAILCAPSRWRLSEKIGQPLADVHGAVPLYADRLSAPVDRFMRNIRAGKLAERLNWSVVDNGALFQLSGKHNTALNASITAENAAARLYLRVERQAFIRLPQTGAVLFAIRVHSYPLTRVFAIPGAAADLAAAVEALPDAMATYKSLPAFKDALLEALSLGERVG